MKIAIFADLHGRILLAWKLVERYQRETGESIDLILQCGDMGIFPNLEKLDRATLKYSKIDRSELGFYDHFLKPKSDIQDLLNKVDCDMLCVRGNHEDHHYLDDIEFKSDKIAFSVDCYNRIFVLKTGHPFYLEKDGEEVSILGIGRIGDRKGRDQGPYIQNYEKKQLKDIIRKSPNIDILLTHDSALDFSSLGFGMKEIRDTLDGLLPHHHFYGHTGEPFSETLDDNELSISCKVKELEYKDNQQLEDGCMLILTKQKGEIEVEAVDADWLKEYRKDVWMHIP